MSSEYIAHISVILSIIFFEMTFISLSVDLVSELQFIKKKNINSINHDVLNFSDVRKILRIFLISKTWKKIQFGKNVE